MIKLKSVRIQKYKSILKEQEVILDPTVTSLVGMNESGKTVFLEILAKANYFLPGDKKFDATLDYPRKELKKYQREGSVAEAIRCKYEISDDLKKTLKDELGFDPILSKEFEISVDYENRKTYHNISSDFKKLLTHLVAKSDLADDLKPIAMKLDSIEAIETYSASLEHQTVKEFLASMQATYNSKKNTFKNKLTGYVIQQFIDPHLPKFWYYDEYFELPSRININHLKEDAIENDDHMKTAKALFELANIDIEQLLSADNFESFIAELEATSAEITEELFKYWTTNRNIEVKFAIDNIEIKSPDPRGGEKIHYEKVLDIRVWNQKHKVSLPLSQRSKGFNWFFSFIVWFSKIQSDKKNNYILLLDEPGLNLHASAQEDLLRYIQELSNNYQIVYTTHSPFMIDSTELHRVRTVMDTDEGTAISETIQEKDPKTLFPLQAALGYDIAQNLFISKNNLVVEGVSDLIYLTVISEILDRTGATGLSSECKIVPVGGLDKVASFISLLRGSDLGIICLLDSFTDQKSKTRLDDLIREKIIKDKSVFFFHDFTETSYAEIEDIFAPDDYLKAFNTAFSGTHPVIKAADLSTTTSGIVRQINEYLSLSRYNHYRVANALSKSVSEGASLSTATLQNFEKIFKQINSRLVV